MYRCDECGAVHQDEAAGESIATAPVATPDRKVSPVVGKTDPVEHGDEEPAEETPEQAPALPVRKSYVIVGAATIAVCCALAVVIGHLPWAGAVLTFVAMVGGGIAAFGPEIEMKRPRFGRAVLATVGALLVLLVEPIERIGNLF